MKEGKELTGESEKVRENRLVKRDFVFKKRTMARQRED
jgi:hypothetical protein